MCIVLILHRFWNWLIWVFQHLEHVSQTLRTWMMSKRGSFALVGFTVVILHVSDNTLFLISGSPYVTRNCGHTTMERHICRHMGETESCTCSYWRSSLHQWMVCECWDSCLISCLFHIFCLHRGPKFRTSFHKLGSLRALTSVPFMALTASAPPSVQTEIVASLYLHTPVVVKRSLDRPNLFLSVGKKSSLAVSQIPRWTKWLSWLIFVSLLFREI